MAEVVPVPAMTHADRALMHALTFIKVAVVRDVQTDDALAVLDDLRGRVSLGNPHVAAMAEAADDLLLYGRPALRSGMDWAMALMAAGDALQTYHCAQMAAMHGRARPDRTADRGA